MNSLIEILLLTLFVTILSTGISALLGLPTAYILAMKNNPITNFFRSITTAMTGLPPVVAGLLIYFLLTRNGPLGALSLLYSPIAMIIAQVLIVFPIITAILYPTFIKTYMDTKETFVGLQLSQKTVFFLMMRECRFAIISAFMMGFGRATSEVGAVFMVGGNIDGKTRVMTTAILTQTNQGNYMDAIILGGILLFISITINLLVRKLKENV
jgi:tungstate transport system permease protein